MTGQRKRVAAIMGRIMQNFRPRETGTDNQQQADKTAN